MGTFSTQLMMFGLFGGIVVFVFICTMCDSFAADDEERFKSLAQQIGCMALFLISLFLCGVVLK